MTSAGAGSEEDRTASPSARAGLLGDVALLVLALLFLVAPICLRSTSFGPLERQDQAARPVRIDINRAAWYEWMLLPEVGEARARQIVEHREAHGGFARIEDLADVPRMPRGWVEKARPYLEVGFEGPPEPR